MKKQLIAFSSASLIFCSGFAVSSQAEISSAKNLAEQSNKLQAAAPAKLVTSTTRYSNKVFTRQKGLVGEQKYIVRFSEEPLATYRGSIAGLKATAANIKRVAGKRQAEKLNSRSTESQAYLTFLAKRHAKMEQEMSARLGRTLDIKRRYRAALNGLSVTMTQDEAERVASLAGIERIEIDHETFPDTDSGPAYIGAPAIWDGSATGVAAKGEGMVIGILDSGINGSHPSFAAVGGDGYEHVNPLGDGVFKGECDSTSADYNAAVECNNKLIGRYLFIDGTPTETDSEDTDGHGTHTASTAGGNYLDNAPIFDAEGNPTGLEVPISGVAPHANIMAFQVCAPSCFTSDRIAAVDQIILDGVVDVINHSIGSSTPINSSPWDDSGQLIWLAAREAGITVANSAGNNGPDPSTLGSAGAPWMTNVAALTHDRAIQPKFLNEFSGGDTSFPADLEGGSVSGAYGPTSIVYAGDFSNGDSNPEQCLTPFPAGTWSNDEIVVCDRGEIARTQKCINVRDGGAAGCVLANIDGGSDSVANDAHVIPAIHINAASGNALKDWLASGSEHMATITDGLLPFGTDPALGSIMADFSSRGPNTSQDYLPVMVGAPGVDIYAAYVSGIEYSFLSGTSMSSPHVAGASTLVKQVRPDWTDAEVQSALATTAGSAIKEDGVTDATPFDVGGGMIRTDLAVQAGLLLDETTANFEAANPAIGGDPKTLNVAGMVNRSCLISCSWTRTVEATTDGSWTVSTTDSAVTVSPASFSLAAGETQSLVVTVDSSEFSTDEWVHEAINLIPAGDLPEQHLTVSFMPSTGEIPEEVLVDATRDVDSYLVAGIESSEITDLQISVGGLVAADGMEFSLSGDSNVDSPFDNLADGVVYTTLTVSDDATRLVAFTTDESSESPDLDLFVGFDSDSDGMPDESELVCISATATAAESCDFTELQTGTYWVAVQNYTPSETSPDAFTLYTAVVGEDNDNLTVDAPSVVPELTPFDLRLIYDLSGSEEGDVFFGTLTLGADASSPESIGVVPVTITRGVDDVVFTASSNTASVGDVLTFTVNLATNQSPEERNYAISASIPEGFSLVEGSVTGGGVTTSDSIEWSISQASVANAQPSYDVVTSFEDSACAVPFANSGAYTDLEQFGLLPDTGITGDTIAYSAFSGQNFNFYGESFVGGFNFTDDGFVFFNSTSGTSPWVNLSIPDATDPNSLIAMLWRDMVVPEPSTTAGSVAGVTLASAGTDLTIIEYDNMELYPGGAGDSVDFQMAISGVADDTAGVYEIMVAFDNVNVSSTDGTIGVEDSTGSTGTQFAFNDVAISDGMAVCFDLVSPTFETVELTYQLVADADSSGQTVIAELSSTVDSLGSVEVVETEVVVVEGDAIAEYETNFFGQTSYALNERISTLMTLTENGVQTNSPDVEFELVAPNGVVLATFTPRAINARGGSYLLVIAGPRRVGVYTLEAKIDGNLIGSKNVLIQ
ncbi:MAG: S8 family serine peptidase [Paraglaciecola sp.]|uniref:S8 family serine peptidase n=1 Tax=Paraglaciecola sp. TaxID=1920173 RepID=UPI003297AACA